MGETLCICLPGWKEILILVLVVFEVPLWTPGGGGGRGGDLDLQQTPAISTSTISTMICCLLVSPHVMFTFEKNMWCTGHFFHGTSTETIRLVRDRCQNTFFHGTSTETIKLVRDRCLNTFFHGTSTETVRLVRDRCQNTFFHGTSTETIRYVRDRCLNTFLHGTSTETIRLIRDRCLNTFLHGTSTETIRLVRDRCPSWPLLSWCFTSTETIRLIRVECPAWPLPDCSVNTKLPSSWWGKKNTMVTDQNKINLQKPAEQNAVCQCSRMK